MGLLDPVTAKLCKKAAAGIKKQPLTLDVVLSLICNQTLRGNTVLALSRKDPLPQDIVDELVKRGFKVLDSGANQKWITWGS